MTFENRLKAESLANDKRLWDAYSLRREAILDSISRNHDTTVDVLGFSFPWSIHAPDPKFGVLCAQQVLRGYAAHPLIAFNDSITEVKLQYDVCDQLAEALVRNKRALRIVTRCNYCSNVKGVKTGGCIEYKLSVAGEAALSKAIDQLVSANDDREAVVKMLRQKYRPEIQGLPRSIREEIKTFLASEKATVEQVQNQTSNTILGSIEHDVIRHLPNYVVIREKIDFETGNY